MQERHFCKVFAGTRSLNSTVATHRYKLQSLDCPLGLCLSYVAVIPQSKDGPKSKCECPAFNSSYVCVLSIYALTFLNTLCLSTFQISAFGGHP